VRFLDLLLNVIALLLWLNWRGMGFHRPGPYRSSLLHTLRIATPPRPRRWRYLAGLLLLLVGRALLYRHFGSPAHWVPHLPLAVISLPFRSDLLGRMMLFSGLSFLLTFAVCYLWLLLISVVNRGLDDTNPVQRLVRLHLGWIESTPAFLKIAGPLLVTALLWLVLHPLFANLGLVPAARSFWQMLWQGSVLALATVLAWKYLLLGVLGLHFLTSYVHLGDSPFWQFVSATGSNLLKPLRIVPLRAGKIDLAPIAALAVVWFGMLYAEAGLTRLFEKL
jgi:uncharacterized protein YggT (Ycf19 family)